MRKWLCLAAATGLSVTAPLHAAPRNVVMIVSDDMGYADTGITGVKDFATPNIDSIAKDGVFCTQAYVTASVCAPSRAGFLTGRYQQRFGSEHNGPPAGLGMRTDQKTIGDHFKNAGYVTGMIGKWHQGDGEPYHPMNRGFDEFVGMLGGGHSYFQQKDAAESEYSNNILDGKVPAKWDGYLTTYFGNRAVDFIDRHAAEPFFLYVAFNAPHTPLQARESDLEKVASIKDERRRKYAAMMLALDESVGQILAELKAKNLEQDTVVIFFSDNGGPQPGDPSVNGSINWPYRSGKAQSFEGGIRVPMFVKVPGVLKAGSTYDKAVSSLDMLPTLLAAVGRQPLAGVELDGKNLLPYLTRQETAAPHERLFWRIGASIAILEGDDKMLVPRRELGSPDNPERPDLSKAIMFNLAKDKSEKQELSRSEHQRFEQLVETWKAWDATLAAPRWGTWTNRKPAATTQATGN